MRPVKLTMQAFGSYGKRTVIDFEKTNQNLFLITGDTGAGKSTVFDALVFALYGEASSLQNKKDGIELQSQFVDYDVEPFVELNFTEDSGGKPKGVYGPPCAPPYSPDETGKRNHRRERVCLPAYA